jgi:hypothetical protein
MVCPKCGSANVSVQLLTQSKLVRRHHSILWWLCIGWWWVPCKWFFFTIPALLVKLLAPKRYKLVHTTTSVCLCQNCGYHWNA